jgi:hypothetical protein
MPWPSPATEIVRSSTRASLTAVGVGELPAALGDDRQADDFRVAARSYSLTIKTAPGRRPTMYAALVTLTIAPDQAPAAANALVEDLLPTVRSAPGFVAGYWLEPADGQGFSVVLFETEEQARQTAPPATSWAAPGVTITGVEFRRVAASA